MRLAILTPALDYYVNWHADAGDYRRVFGEAVSFREWRDPGNLKEFDLIMPLLVWGYQHDPVLWDAHLAAWRGLPFANTLPTLRWNTRKTYLVALESRGVAIVPTRVASSFSDQDLESARAIFGDVALVVKPTISGGAEGTHLLRPGDPVPTDVALREMLIQPLMSAISEEGEFSLFYFGGEFSHAILKRPAAGDFRVQEQFGGTEIQIEPPLNSQHLANSVLSALHEPPLYARVDMIRGADGEFQLMELELIEPSLFLRHAPDRGAMFAQAVQHHVEKNHSG
ncbi:ATP-grasp domain-containing protein [Aquisediminimonas profunda]|uniref:ATP-grasp domain-containing protein n=1 Tax=Aquisediminimonas profunda TaxID=1550733 RepID=UPI001C638710|nr:hypothetical protein [Aquisediminimonas profunda]